MLQIQQQMMSMFQVFSTAHTQQIAEERESRRLKEETEQHWREEESVRQQQIDEQRCAEQDRREEQRLETRRRDTPKLQPMEKGEDVEDYLEDFEAYVEDIQLEKEQWITYLRPLLNKECQDAITGLDAENCNNYDIGKETITDQWNTLLDRPGALQTLQRFQARFLKGVESLKEANEHYCVERIIQDLTGPAARFVQDKQPKLAKEAAKLADQFFFHNRSSPDDPRWSSILAAREGSNYSFGRQMGRKSRYSQSWRQNQHDSPDYGKSARVGGTKEKFQEGNREARSLHLSGEKKQIKCYSCSKWGHIANKCPAKLMAVLTPSKKPNLFIIEGTIQGKKFRQLILDSGADATIISEMAVPRALGSWLYPVTV